MKTLALLPCCLLLIANTPALAIDSKYCESQGARLTGAEHAVFMKSCLAKIGTPEHVDELTRQNKKSYCENNAKNKALLGAEKANYIATCMEKNEAAEALAAPPEKHALLSGTDTPGTTSDNATPPKTPAANAATNNNTTPQKASAVNAANDTAATPPKTSTANATANNAAPPPELTQSEITSRSCDQEAKQKNLKGGARKQFIATCEDELELARYRLAGDELKKHKRNDALWYKAFAEANGEKRAAEAAYIRMRVNQLRHCCSPAK